MLRQLFSYLIKYRLELIDHGYIMEVINKVDLLTMVNKCLKSSLLFDFMHMLRNTSFKFYFILVF